MKHIWINTEQTINKIAFRYKLDKPADRLVLSASAFYTVFFNNKLVSYGPERTANGYSRIREIPITNKNVEIEVLVYDYGIPSLDKDFGKSFFGCEIFNKEKLVASTNDFKAFSSTKFDTNTIKYSFQRGFVERFNLRNIHESELSTFEVNGIELLKGVGDKCCYNKCSFPLVSKSVFNSFEKVNLPNYIDPLDKKFSIKNDFLDLIKGYNCKDFELKEEKSGLIKLKIISEVKDVKVFLVFDEYLENGKWTYGRSSCNDLITIDLDEFDGEIITSTIYSLKHLRILTNKDIKIIPSLILIQNDDVPQIKKTGDLKIDLILNAARNTFMQNAVDIYTDCPSRERAGWLCDGYFTALAENFFTGNNQIEKCFLENFILGNFEELDKGMIPMCFPAQEKLFIPNWAMWFVLELEQYYLRTNDRSLIDLSYQKIQELLHYFEKFENEYSLLENLDGWVFVEWSDAGTEEYVNGISFPTNMLYAAMLESSGRLYKDKNLLKKAKLIKENINKLSFNGKFYIDNALRENGKLVLQENHTSETCQYYALFFKLNNNEQFTTFIKNELGPLRGKNKYNDIARSNSFIGNYLRFLWLNENGENERIKKEAIDYFYNMASYSGTLWEKSVPNASCNHGFASSIAPILISNKLLK